MQRYNLYLKLQQSPCLWLRACRQYKKCLTVWTRYYMKTGVIVK